MSDEVAQVIQLEIQGITMVVKASLQVGSWLIRALNAMIQHNNENVLNKSGGKSLKDMLQLSAPGMPQIIKIPEKYANEILQKAKANGLRFCSVADLDLTDGKMPVVITQQEAVVFSEIVSSYLMRDIHKQESNIKDYDKLIAEKSEEILHANQQDKEKLQVEIENLKQARDEANEFVKDTKATKENPITSFQDYLMGAVGTEFEKDPDKAMSEYAQGVELVKKFDAKECLQPVRHEEMMPETRMKFYLPETGMEITRTFQMDEKTKIVYSTYSLKTEKGEIHEFSDRGITKENWNSEIIGQLMDKAGITEETKCCVFTSEEALNTYKEKHDQIKPLSETNIEHKQHEQDVGFQKADVQNEVKNAAKENLKLRTSASAASNSVTYDFDKEKIIQENGKLKILLSEDASLEISGISKGKIENGKASITLDQNQMIVYTSKNSDSEYPVRKEVSALQGKKILDDHISEKMNLNKVQKVNR